MPVSCGADTDSCSNSGLRHCTRERRIWSQVSSLSAVQVSHGAMSRLFCWSAWQLHPLLQLFLCCSAFVEPGVIVMILVANGMCLSQPLPTIVLISFSKVLNFPVAKCLLSHRCTSHHLLQHRQQNRAKQTYKSHSTLA